MKTLVMSLFMLIIGTSVLAQNKIHCFKKNKTTDYYCIDSTDSEYYNITIFVDSCSSTTLKFPSEYYQESDSIIIKIREKNIFDGNACVQASYCYSVGMHNIALYLNPKLFSVSTSGGYDFFYSIKLFYRDDSKYLKNQ